MNQQPIEAAFRGAAVREPIRIDWLNVVGIGYYHLVALLAFVPWFFSWTGVTLAIVGSYVFGTLGINLCYHRLLTHRGFVCPKWLEHGLALLAVLSFQDTPARWVAVHRRHHEHADEDPDPHSPIVNFVWAHMGWLFVRPSEMERTQIYPRYAKDILRDPLYRRMENPAVYLGTIIASWGVFFALGTAAALVAGSAWPQALQFGASVLVWGVFVRTVLVWHLTWSVNSVTHMFGYRNYETDEESRNNIVVGLLTNGEGWHNNHHADPRSARHGHLWYEVDVTYLSLRALAALGLASKIAEPNRHRLAAAGRLQTRAENPNPTPP
ncbi:MAG: fatty acid desaturase [Mesorhizobium sp.]|nr:fatty acid desaturase [Mesorhizobium sp.]